MNTRTKLVLKWLIITIAFILTCFITFVFYIFLTEYIHDRCTIKLGYEIESTLFEDVYIDGQDYFSLIEDAIEKDSIALRKLSSVSMDHGREMKHCAIAIDIIKYVGEDYYYSVVKTSNERERENIRHMLYTASDFYFFEKFNIESEFPKLYKEFCSIK